MRIKKLELVGFKSFKDKTVIHFDKGITGIVGPNGCGKSNIVDALTWVMGEMSAKHLRGSSMTDVIFAGAEGYAPLGLAEVSLTLENDGGPFPVKYIKHSEIMVTRRLHRSGESEYLINKEPSRLRDIQEIFMDTGAGSKGFSIIEQGRIGEIITAKPESRRTLIEEVAGITKFKVRKKESQRKLVSTDQNLVRLQDIIGEQKRQLDSLQRQAQRAERYRNIKKDLQDKEVWLSAKKFNEFRTESEQAQQDFALATEGEVSSTSNISQLEIDVQDLKLKVSEKESLVNEIQLTHEQKQKLVSEKEHEIRELTFEIEQAKRDKEMAGTFTNQYQVRMEALQEDKTELETKHENIKSEFEALDKDYQEKNGKYQELNAKITTADRDLTVKRKEMLTVSQSFSHMDAKKTSLEAQKEESEKRFQDSGEVLNELESKFKEYEGRYQTLQKEFDKEKQLHLDIMKDTDNFNENLNLVKNQFETKQVDVSSFKDKLNEVTSRLYGLEDLQSNFEGFEAGVKSVMLWQRKKMETTVNGGMQASASFQPMTDVVEVPAEYEMAMEASLGSKLQLLLSSNSNQTLEAVDYLKQNKSGRSGFITDSQNYKKECDENKLRSENGVSKFLSDVVKVPEKYNKQVSYFLKDVVIVDSIRTALNLRPNYPGKSFVTLDGDSLSPDGVLTGGSAEGVGAGVLKRKREIKDLSMKREESAGKLSLAVVALEKLEKQFKQMEVELSEAKRRSNEKEIQIVELKKDLEQAETEMNNGRISLERQQKQVDECKSHFEKLGVNLNEIINHITETTEKKTTLEKEVAELDQVLIESKDGIDELQEDVTRLQIQSAAKKQAVEGLNNQMEMLASSIKEVEEQMAQMTEKDQLSTTSMTDNQQLLETSKVNLESLIRETNDIKTQLSQLKNEYEEIQTESREKEKRVSEILREKNEQQAKINEAQLKVEQLKMQEKYIIDQMHERYMLDITLEFTKFLDIEGDVKSTEKEVEDLKKKMSRIGEVNLSAIEEYEALIDRYEFLKEQHEDLLAAKDQLRKVIDRINRICSRRFRETFDMVNERFVKVFPVLFGGGEANLTLIEYPEKDEVGVDIMARPPGKKLQNVSLLSGGEKALTAVSLIFSIFLVKPSPFCLLDEVDAPLDDANVFRFNDLVKEMAKRSQIIVVTHNKYTMKVNNKLFGVTMEEKGVSKMVSVSLAEAQKVIS